MTENKGIAFEEAYKVMAKKLIYIIENAKFNRVRKGGYDMDQVDEFLDSLMIEIDRHSKHERIADLINTTKIVNVLFDKQKGGYNMGEIDDFLDLLEMEVEGLNEVKLRFM